MDVKVYMDSYMASNGQHFMVTWTMLKKHLLEVGLTQILETTTLRMLITIDLFYFIMCEDPHEYRNSLKYHFILIISETEGRQASTKA